MEFPEFSLKRASTSDFQTLEPVGSGLENAQVNTHKVLDAGAEEQWAAQGDRGRAEGGYCFG